MNNEHWKTPAPLQRIRSIFGIYSRTINREESVYNWLVNRGVDPKRLRYAGFEKSHPPYNETDEQLRAQNRRVDLLKTRIEC